MLVNGIVAARAFLAVVAIGVSSATFAAEDPPQVRTWAELSAETQARVDRQAYPLAGLKPEDIRAQLSTIHGFDRDAWASAWIATGDKYKAKADAERDNLDQRRADLGLAWRYYAFGRWPVPIAAAQHQAHDKAKQVFAEWAELVKPQIHTVKIPFEGRFIYANLQLPEGVRPAPLVLSIGGVDSWRDVVAVANQPFVNEGIASLAVDMPGTGESPVKTAPDAERVFSAVLDWVATQPDLDAKRVVVRGQSWGGYWAARVGLRDSARLCGVVDQGGPADAYFTPAWQNTSLKTKEYLFDFVQSRLFVWGRDSVSSGLEFLPEMSLRRDNILDKPTPPMLLIDGVNDTQTPIADLLLLLTHGSAKEAWVNAAGGHMGRGPKMDDRQIFQSVVLSWISRHLKQDCLATNR